MTSLADISDTLVEDAARPAPAPPLRASHVGANPKGSRLAANFLLLTGGELIAKALTFVVFAYLARVLGPASYGNLDFVIGIMVFFTLPVDSGLGAYGAREVARSPSARGELLQAVAGLRFSLACVSFAVLLGVLWFLPIPAEVKLLLSLYGLTLFAAPWLTQWFFQGHDQTSLFAVVSIVRQTTFAVLTLLLVGVGTPLPWVGVLECTAVLAAVATCLILLRRRLDYGPPKFWRVSANSWRHWRLAAPIGASELTWACMWYFATVYLRFQAGEQALGWFAVAHRVVMALHAFVWLYFFNLLPTLSRAAVGDGSELRRLLRHSLILTTLPGLVLAGLIAWLAEPLVVLGFGEQFAPGASVLAVLIWIIPVAQFSGHFRYLLIACNRQRSEFLAASLAALTTVGLCFALVPAHGMLGGAWALLAAAIVNCLLALFLARRCLASFSVTSSPENFADAHL